MSQIEAICERLEEWPSRAGKWLAEFALSEGGSMVLSMRSDAPPVRPGLAYQVALAEQQRASHWKKAQRKNGQRFLLRTAPIAQETSMTLDITVQCLSVELRQDRVGTFVAKFVLPEAGGTLTLESSVVVCGTIEQGSTYRLQLEEVCATLTPTP